jgi:hypothetical protein
VDTSGSMTHQIAGFTNLSAREVAAAMALVAYRTEPNFEIVGFSSSIQKDLPIQKTSTLSDVMSTILRLDATYTYCRLPITDAMTTKDDFDAFIFYTDSETADGNPLRQHNRDDNHPFSHYLSEYREQRVENAKIVVVAACATEFTLNDPSDVLGLDIAGFGTDVPAVISSFIGDVPEPKVPQPVETPTVQVPTPDHRKDVVTSPPPSTV